MARPEPDVVLVVARRDRGARGDVAWVAAALRGLGLATRVDTIAEIARRGEVRAPAVVLLCETAALRGPIARQVAGAARSARLAPPSRTLRAAARARLLAALRARGVAVARASP